MNNLSWMLYVASVSGSLQGLMTGIASLAGLCAALTWSIRAATEGDANFTGYCKWLIPLCIASALIACIIPDKTSVYLIAASETGQQAMATETGKKAVEAINRYLEKAGQDDKK